MTDKFIKLTPDEEDIVYESYVKHAHLYVDFPIAIRSRNKYHTCILLKYDEEQYAEISKLIIDFYQKQIRDRVLTKYTNYQLAERLIQLIDEDLKIYREVKQLAEAIPEVEQKTKTRKI